ncbi:MAG: hypothetical protein JOZ68_10150 [Acidimicrobiia bacterium]|nr:hypothetical protein [Acidimicrobiia bacterium]
MTTRSAAPQGWGAVVVGDSVVVVWLWRSVVVEWGDEPLRVVAVVGVALATLVVGPGVVVAPGTVDSVELPREVVVRGAAT